jgi:hypothetical protein
MFGMTLLPETPNNVTSHSSNFSDRHRTDELGILYAQSPSLERLGEGKEAQLGWISIHVQCTNSLTFERTAG